MDIFTERLQVWTRNSRRRGYGLDKFSFFFLWEVERNFSRNGILRVCLSLLNIHIVSYEITLP